MDTKKQVFLPILIILSLTWITEAGWSKYLRKNQLFDNNIVNNNNNNNELNSQISKIRNDSFVPCL